jgi:hypothetical protein
MLAHSPHSRPLRLSVVYFSVVNPNRDWKRFFDEQLGQLVSSRLTVRASIEVILSSMDANEVTSDSLRLLQQARAHVHKTIPTATVTLAGSNHFEYPGIRRVWELAVSDADPENHVIVYFHGKSMVNHGADGLARSELNKHLMDTVIYPWNDVLQAFASNSTLQTAGYAIGDKGNAWFNFWWARSSYLARLVEPKLTRDRYYFEHWLSFMRPDVCDRPDRVRLAYNGDGTSCQTVYPAAFAYSGPENSISLCPGAQGVTSFPEDLDLIMDMCKANIAYISTRQC